MFLEQNEILVLINSPKLKWLLSLKNLTFESIIESKISSHFLLNLGILNDNWVDCNDEKLAAKRKIYVYLAYKNIILEQ